MERAGFSGLDIAYRRGAGLRSEPMRITLIISSLWGGGAERVASVLASGWAEGGDEVSVLTFHDQGGDTYAVHERVQIRCLYLYRPSGNPVQGLLRSLRRIVVLRRAIRKSAPHVVISFGSQSNVLTLLATRGLGVPVVVRETVDPIHQNVGFIWSRLRRICYPLADALVCATVATVARFQAIANVRGAAIANPVLVPAALAFREQRSTCSRQCTLVAMGRLVSEKGFDLLLPAFARIADRHQEWSLTIIGSGPLQSQLERQSQGLGLNQRVHFTGQLTDPFSILRAADLFVFSSRWETFGMALAEAMACGLPAVSFDCPDGPREIIRDGIDGVLVPPGDVDALAAVLDRLMSDSHERARLAARAPEVMERFSIKSILSLWQQLFSQLAAGRNSL
jgi:GalNAc-alpha-(1->4)-GalNAc-alpha-(1->3)-diNAcBac-PP-undecaprenol alpha-1,4-N-acetyl-D-galactosaminyltransferase